MLYIALGDGGSAGDPQGNAQDVRSLLGKLLRIDVSKSPYGIPADNPFVRGAHGARGEIFATVCAIRGAFSFDRANGQLWAGDVGQNTYEEIDIIEKGKNYGWDCREAAHPFSPRASSAICARPRTDLVDPVWEVRPHARASA
jgi:glucose/arabinose dehydrogenase